MQVLHLCSNEGINLNVQLNIGKDKSFKLRLMIEIYLIKQC